MRGGVGMFVNREEELKLLDKFQNKGKLAVVYGRRRVGKTSLIEHWGRAKNVIYSQAVEGTSRIQINQLVSDLGGAWPEGIVPTDWSGFLAALALIPESTIIMIDEFSYLTQNDASVASMWQKWIDHKQPQHLKLILLGSSQTMMHGLFLDESSPLFGRAQILLHLEPMGYREFCKWLGCDYRGEEAFVKYAMVGGVPQYWQYTSKEDTPLGAADQLFFAKHGRLQNEADRLLKDERVEGITAKSILEAIGRGAAKPSEIGGRLGIPQTSLGRPMQVLMASSLVARTIPFGESMRSTKRVLYEISDPALRFWYNVYSPHRSRWHLYSKVKREDILRNHAARVLEQSYRSLFPDACRYWEGDFAEFDAVRHADETGKSIIVSEIKWGKLDNKSKGALRLSTSEKFNGCSLALRYKLADIEILDFGDVVRALGGNRSVRSSL